MIPAPMGFADAVREWVLEDPASTAFRAGLVLSAIGVLLVLPLFLFTTYLWRQSAMMPQRTFLRALAVLIVVSGIIILLILARMATLIAR